MKRNEVNGVGGNGKESGVGTVGIEGREGDVFWKSEARFER